MKQDALTTKYPYRCNVCHWLYWFSYQDIMSLTDTSHLPCTHSWLALEYAHDRDGETAPNEQEEPAS